MNNVLSFGEEREFNMLPNKGLKTLKHHKYKIRGFEILKLASLYGANGAGKSNLVQAMRFLQGLVIEQEIPLAFRKSHFRFQPNPTDSTQTIQIEFVSEGIPFYYGVEIEKGNIISEELYISGLGKKEDELIFERQTNSSQKTTIKFLPAFEKDKKSQLLKEVLIEEFVKSHRTVLKLLSNRENEALKMIKPAYNWFIDTLNILGPNSRPWAMAHNIDNNKEFQQYVENVMCAFDVGIKSIGTSRTKVKDFFGREMNPALDEVLMRLEESPNELAELELANGKQVVLVKEEGEVYVKQLQLEHEGKGGHSALFELEEESDGTVRLLDFVPAFREINRLPTVYVIDEIERSIHPLLIREMVKKFSLDKETKGQLIFTTHESNLLDQLIFRQDEIWFAEKDQSGSTDLYSLNDFKEHKTIDIRKGYLNGRYGSVPFLGNLEELNWNTNVVEEPVV